MKKNKDSGLIILGNLMPSNPIGDKYRVFDTGGVSPTILATHYKNMVKIMEVKKIGNIYGFTGGNYAGNVYNSDGLCPTINICNGGNRQSIIVESSNKRDSKNDSASVTTIEEDGTVKRYRLRKLTPRECWRLMGFSDIDFEKAQTVNSNTQLYKQAGNSIVLPVLKALFAQLNIR